MITVVRSPQKYTLADNSIIFQIESDNANINYFEVKIIDVLTTQTVDKLRVKPAPDYPTGNAINIQRILSNLVKWEITNVFSPLVVPVKRSLYKYNIEITEKLLVSGSIVDGDIWTSQNSFIFYGELDRISFAGFTMNEYVIPPVGTAVKFLTDKPNKTIVNDSSAEMLYLLQDLETSLKVIVKTYDRYGSNLNVYSTPINDLENKMFRIQASPKALKNTLFVDFTDVDSYTVHVENGSNTIRTEVRKYYYRPLPCNVEPVNILWSNPYGGFDSYQFLNPQENIKYNRTTIKRNPFRFSDNVYSDRTGDIVNSEEEVFNINKSGEYTATSSVLTDAEAYWLNQLFGTKQAFVELTDGTLIPVTISNTSYQVQKQKYNKSTPITTQVIYNMSDTIIPQKAVVYDGSTGSAGGSGILKWQFIDEQMNTIILPIFDTNRAVLQVNF